MSGNPFAGFAYGATAAGGSGAAAAPLAASINWILKDGIGQAGGIAFTTYEQ